MMLKRSTQPKPQPQRLSARLVRASLAGLAVVTAVAGLATGCLDRKVVPAKPTTSNVFVDQIQQTAVDKIDLLFMIDNSVSMADKQEILKAAVPVLLGRLVTPICVDANGAPTGGNANQATGLCPAPNSPEFAPIGDIHIGIVSSSLGAHGGSVCANLAPGDDPARTHLDDKAHLIGSTVGGVNNRAEAMPALATYGGLGFLAWDPTGTKNTPAGESNAATLGTNFANLVQAVGEHGCGYEASLESWYRFLVDPEPPATVTKVGGQTVRSAALDTDLLAQRAAFLRPDSLVAIVMLSDENDCSIRDDGVGWFVGATSHMPKSTAPCATNPNDACCRSCAQSETSPPAGCAALSADSVCMGAVAPNYNTWDNLNDSLNLRCYNQKQRFGFDLLYPTQRYVDALSNPVVTVPSTGMTTVNPLYATGNSGKAPRDASLIFLAGIVGVPWQDIATPDSLASPTALTYLTATEIAAQGRWTQLLGDAAASPPVAPTDPFMIETTQPRAGTNPNANAALGPVDIVPSSSNNPKANQINGHEQNIPLFDDLQYACTFPLGAPKPCAGGDAACDCSPTMAGDSAMVTAANSPLCQPPGGGAPGVTQYFAKAYPGARELTVLRDFGANAVVASICPKVQSPTTDPNYGYNPAVGAIINRLKEALKGKCLPRPLSKNADGTVQCQVIEASKISSDNNNCDCTRPGRQAADKAIYPAVFNQLEASKTCGNATGQTKCDTTAFCMCEITQEVGADLNACQQNASTGAAGYCYIDKNVMPASTALKNCPDNQKQLLRFVDQGDTKTPAQGSIAFIACLGAPIGSDGGM